MAIMNTARDKTSTIVVADDHDIVRSGLVASLSQISNLCVVAEADNGLTAISKVKEHSPDLLILDAAMPMARGVEVHSEARRWCPDTKTILFTGFTSRSFLNEWMQSGVEGILLKSCSESEIIQGVSVVLAGGVYVAEAAQDLLENKDSSAPLTDREREVMSLVVTGYFNNEIADKLNISPKTVEKHRASMMTKLGVRSAAELMLYAHKEGLLDEFKQL